MLKNMAKGYLFSSDQCFKEIGRIDGQEPNDIV